MTNLLNTLPKHPSKIGWPWNKETNPLLYSDRKHWPKITIVTPSYNQGMFIEETIRSILLQNYPNLEYIVVDGNSTDNTIEILKKYNDWITYWISEDDEGQSDAINKGINIATGDLFNWINSDDILAENSLLSLASYFSESTDVHLMNLSIANVDTSNIVYSYRQKIADNVSDTLVDHLIAQPSTFYKLSIINKIGGIASDFHFVMDLFLWVRYLLEYGQEHIINNPNLGAIYREHQNTKTKLLTKDFEKETLEVFRFTYLMLKRKKHKCKTSLIKFTNFEVGLTEEEKRKIIKSIRQRHYFLFKKNLLH
ncbi:MAG: glycosyltransferase, partial [Flavobacterium sp.]